MEILKTNPELVNNQNHEKRRSSVMAAADKGHLSVVKTLIDFGANVNSVDEDKWTALHLASSGGHLAVVEHLVRRGAEVNARTAHLTTSIMFATFMGHLEVRTGFGSNALEF